MKQSLLLKDAILRLAALAQETRLQAFMMLVKAGRSGMIQGDLARRLKIPPQTLSFHLKQLSSAGLVRSERDGTTISYFANFEEARRLLNFVSLNCCVGFDRKQPDAAFSIREIRR